MTTSDKIIPTGKYIARIVEEECIGCTLCINACPFDAIIGASKHIHTVISHYCTGCKLCIPPCPVDCIKLNENIFFKSTYQNTSKEQQSELKKRFAEFSRHNKKQRSLRLNNIKQAKQDAFERKKKELLNHQ